MSRLTYFLLCLLHPVILLNSLSVLSPVRETDLYNKDYHAWINEQIRYINESNFHLLDQPNLLEELRMMAANRGTVRVHLEHIIIHMLKMACDPLYLGLRSWMSQINSFRKAIEDIAKDDSGVRADLKEYYAVVDKRDKNREFTRLEKVLQEEWEDATKIGEGHIAFSVWDDSEGGVNFDDVPETCPLTLEQILTRNCFPRKAHYGPELDCSGRAQPNQKEEKKMKRAKKQNVSLDDYFRCDGVPDADVCPEGFY